jgi:hypothetical protein
VLNAGKATGLKMGKIITGAIESLSLKPGGK